MHRCSKIALCLRAQALIFKLWMCVRSGMDGHYYKRGSFACDLLIYCPQTTLEFVKRYASYCKNLNKFAVESSKLHNVLSFKLLYTGAYKLTIGMDCWWLIQEERYSKAAISISGVTGIAFICMNNLAA